MLKKTIEYVDYNGEKIKEDYYFNLKKSEVMEMQLGTAGGFAEHLQKLVDSKNVPEITKAFKEIILVAYGIKSDDGKRFIKSKEIRDSFEQTEAFSELFMELIQNADACNEFIKGIMPEASKSAETAPALEHKN